MWRRVLAVCGLLLVAGVSSGRGYQSENESIVAELPTFDGVALIDEDHYGFCSGDSCLLGDDRSGALLMYTVDTGIYSMMTLAEAYQDALPEWEALIEDGGCLNDEPSFCHEIVFATFSRGEEQISLNLDNWPAGQFELHVDARGAR